MSYPFEEIATGDPRVRLFRGDCVEVLRACQAIAPVDGVCTDPPYHLTSIVKRFGADNAAAAKDRDGLYARASKGFMGKTWDGGDTAFRADTWAAIGALLKPGGYLSAFSGTRTYHRMACAIEDAGLDIRDLIAWLYGTGFPKSEDIERAVARRLCKEFGRHYERSVPPEDKRRVGDHVCAACDESRAFDGFGTALKPALEPVCFARRPLIGTFAENVLTHRTGGLHIDACRVDYASEKDKASSAAAAAAAQRSGQDRPGRGRFSEGDGKGYQNPEDSLGRFFAKQDLGRWPANVAHDGSDEVIAAFPNSEGAQSAVTGREPGRTTRTVYAAYDGGRQPFGTRGDEGSAARFFFSAKADADDRLGSDHPTVKPLTLMRWLIRLTVPPGGTVLDPFAGTGTTGIAALAEGRRAILIERDPAYSADILARIAHATGKGAHSNSVKARKREPKADHGPLFAAG